MRGYDGCSRKCRSCRRAAGGVLCGVEFLPEDRAQRDVVDMELGAREVNRDRPVLPVGRLRARLHAARIEAHEARERDLVAEACDDDVVVLHGLLGADLWKRG